MEIMAARTEEKISLESAAAESRYCTFVDPGHGLVAEIFPSAATGAGLEDYLAALRRKCFYISRPGRLSFDQLAAQGDGPRGRLELNCVNMICLLVSGLRRGGRGENEVFAALAGVRGYLQYHAWALVRREAGGGYWWIDPVDLVAQPRGGGELLARYDFYAIFNDRRLAFTREEKRRLLEEEGS